MLTLCGTIFPSVDLAALFVFQPLANRNFPSSIISNNISASPVTVVPWSSKMLTTTIPTTRAIIISPSEQISVQSATQPSVTILKTEACSKSSPTALDVLNETIVKSFDASNSENNFHIKGGNGLTGPSDSPLNLIKNVHNATTLNEHELTTKDVKTEDGINTKLKTHIAPKHVILHVGKNNVIQQKQINSYSSAQIVPITTLKSFPPNTQLINSTAPESVVIKCEPDFTIAEGQSPASQSVIKSFKNRTDNFKQTKSMPNISNDNYSSIGCIASGNSSRSFQFCCSQVISD